VLLPAFRAKGALKLRLVLTGWSEELSGAGDHLEGSIPVESRERAQ
jgi:hypothetical protein